MAGLMSSVETRGQLAAIAQVRWQLVVNSLRTIRGRLEMVSKVFMALGIAMAGLGGSVGVAFASWYFVSHAEVEFLAVPLWLMFIFWQLFPVMATAFTETADSSNLLRFPLSYRSFFLIQMVYGSLDAPTALCCMWLVGMTIGAGIADRGLLFWAAIILATFALMNLLLARMIFAWVERWLAKRRSREIIGVLFFVLIICVQLINPLMSRYATHARPGTSRTFEYVMPYERILPPGLAAGALAHAGDGESAKALGSFALLCVYSIAIFWFLNLRVRRQYLGENLSEGAARVAGPKGKVAVREGWDIPHASGPVAAIFEKEFRYLSRSGPMLFVLVMPVVVLVIFRFALAGGGKNVNFLTNAPDLAFPIGAAYTLMMMVNLVYNSFGPDATGIQFFFSAPVRFREILLAKNLAQATVVGLEIVAVWIAASLLFGPPSFGITCATIAGVLYGVPLNLAVGDILSLYSPKKIDFGTLGRQRATGITAVSSLGTQAVVMGIAVLTYFAARFAGSIWIATVVYLVLAGIAITGYFVVLDRVDGIAITRRETLIAELSRA
jgi:ABC-2 type transport system permease protein